LIAVGGIAMAYMVFVRGVVSAESLYSSLKPVHTLFKEQFFTELFYHRFLARGYLGSSRILYGVGERQFIDGIVNALAQAVQGIGAGFRFLQGGKLNWYALSAAAGFGLLILLLVALIHGGGR